MTWNIRIYPLEPEAFLKALNEYVVTGTAAEIEHVISAKYIVVGILSQPATRNEDAAAQLYECSLSGVRLPEAASLSINVYRRRAETPQPQPAESEETAPEEVTPEATESPPEPEATSEE